MAAYSKSKRSRFSTSRLLTLGLAGALTLVGAEVSALEITLSYRTSTGIGTPDAPAADPGGAELQRIMRAAADYWEDIFPVDHTINIRYRYDDVAPWANARLYYPNPIDSDDRIKKGTIRFDINSAWYYDPTPFDNSEFTMNSTAFFDASSGTQSIYSGAQNSLEVGFGGSKINATGEGDLFHIALHEMGHLLGVSSFSPRFSAETSDGDVDFSYRNPGSSGSTSITANSGGGHLGAASSEAQESLMGPGTPSDYRSLPTATDILVIAALNGWDEVNLPRRDFLDDGDGQVRWYRNQQWAGDKQPDANSDAYLRDPSMSLAIVDNKSTPARAKNLFVQRQIELQIDSDASLVVAELADIRENAHVTVDGQFFAETIEVRDNGRFGVQYGGIVSMSGGSSHIYIEDSNSSMMNAGSVGMYGSDLLIERGTVYMSGGTFYGGYNHVHNGDNGLITGSGLFTEVLELTNSGDIEAGQEGLVFQDGPLLIGQFDLDGWETTTSNHIEAIDGSITFRGQITDEYNQDMTIGEAQSIRFQESLFGGTGGVIDIADDALVALRGGTSSTRQASFIAANHATMGGKLTVLGQGNVTAPTILFELNTTTGEGSDVYLAPDALLRLNGGIIYDGVESFGFGPTSTSGYNTIVLQNGDAHVTADTVIGRVTVYDLDGITDDHDLWVHGGARLDLHADSIESSYTGSIGYDGEITVASDGALGIHTTAPWRLNGTLAVGQNAVVDGAFIENAGTIRGHGMIDTVVIDHGGTVDPGSSPGELTLLAYDGSSAGTVLIELGGEAPGTEHDVLKVIGDAELAGELDVSLYGGYVPDLYVRHTILTAGRVIDAFDVHTLFNVSGSYTVVEYDATSIDVFLAMSGDFDADGDIDGADLSYFLSNFTGPGVTTSDPLTDLDGDGDTDGADFSILASSFTGPLSPAVVPEPGALSLLAFGLGLIARRRRA